MGVDEIRSELVAILDRLADLPEDAFADGLELRQRQDELCSQLAQTPLSRVHEESLEDLRARIAHLTRRIEAIKRGQVSHLAGVGTGIGGGIDPEHVLRLNRQIDRAQGTEELLAELRTLRRRFEELEGEGPS